MNDESDLRQAAIAALRKLHQLRDFHACVAAGARAADDLLNELEGVLLRIVVTRVID